MRRFSRFFLHYRPRMLTLVVFCASAAVLALANATYPTMAFESDGKCTHTAYGGWPLVWSRWVSNHGHTAIFPWLKASFWINALPEECKQLAW